MRKIIASLLNTSPSPTLFNTTMLFFRGFLAVEMMLVHGLKKIGAAGGQPEIVPNPLHLPETFNHWFATAANLVFPLFVIIGLSTRLAILLIVAVPLTGYFIVHSHDPLPERDVPFMYSISYLLVLFLGPGKYSIDYLLAGNKSKLLSN